MNYYGIYQLTWRTNFPLRLPIISKQVPDFTIYLEEGEQTDESVEWIHDYQKDSENVWQCLGLLGNDYLIRFSGYADFRLNTRDKNILCRATPGIDLRTIEHLLINQIIPRVMSLYSLVLHAGSVMTKQGSIALLGKTGCGKSTLTSLLGREGFPILTDDCLTLKQDGNDFWTLPSHSPIRLKKDIAAEFVENAGRLPKIADFSSKRRLDCLQGGYITHTQPEILAGLFLLSVSDPEEKSDIVAIKPCSKRKAFAAILENSFRLDPSDKKTVVREFHLINRVLENVPVYQLIYPRQINMMSQVIHIISAWVDESDKVEGV